MLLGLTHSLISNSQLRDSGCQVMLDEHSFKLHHGQLVLACGASVGTIYAMQVHHMRHGIVSMSMQPCTELRQVSFEDRLQDALPMCE